MPHQPQARPTRRQHRPSQGFVGKAIQDPEHVIALTVQEERSALLSLVTTGCDIAPPLLEVLLVRSA